MSLSSACGGARVTAADARWVRTDTPHFSLYTDLSAPRAEYWAAQLERLLAAYLENGWQVRGELPLKLNVVMFGNPDDFATYGGRDLGGYHMPELQFEPWIMLPDPSRGGSLDTLRHELTHYIAHQGMHAQPPWFSEGIASYFQTATFDANSGGFTIGAVPRGRHADVKRLGLMHAKVLFADDVDRRSSKFYATSWLLVHYLMSVHSDRFSDYQRRIAVGQADADAWNAAFPALPRDKLDPELVEYYMLGSYAKFSLPVSPRKQNVARSTQLGMADRHALQALLYLGCFTCSSDAFERAQQHVDLALATDPVQPQAAVLRLAAQSMTPAARIAAARQLTEARPNVWLGWLALGFALADAGQLGSVDAGLDPVARIRALAPRQPYGKLLSARQRAQRGDHAGAVADAEQVRRMAPTNVRLLARSAWLLADLSACDALARVLHTIDAVDHDALDPTQREDLFSRAGRCVRQ